MSNVVYTIGHSNHEFPCFLELLRRHSIDMVCDVRSAPVSRLPHFCKDELAALLADANIQYASAGASLGARSKDPADYFKGQVQFAKLAEKPLFQKAIARLRQDARTKRIALMCAEKEPLDCHRTILVARHVEDEHTSVSHILETGALESHRDAMLRLIDTLSLPIGHMFYDTDFLIGEAYSLQEKRVAYSDAAPAIDTVTSSREIAA